MARETRALPGRRQRGLGPAKAGSGKSVGTVSHRPFPRLPGEVGQFVRKCHVRRNDPPQIGPYQRGLRAASGGAKNQMSVTV